MVISILASMLLTFNTSSTIQNNFYNFGAKVTATRYLDSLVGETLTDNPYYFDSNIQFSCDLSYDDSSSYYINNCTYTFKSNLYYINGATGNRELEHTFISTYTFDWEITPSSYLGEFDKVSFKVNANDDDAYNQILFDGTAVVTSASYICDEDFRFPVTQNISLNSGGVTTASFIYQIEQWLTLKSDTSLYDEGFADGREQGEQDGYTRAYTELSEVDSTAVTIFTGICNIGLMPVNFFLGILNFEVFGINIGAFVSALLTIAIIAIIIKVVTGNSSGGDSK